MADEILLPDDGMLTLNFQGAAAEVDLYEAMNRVNEIFQVTSGKRNYEFHEAVKKLLVEKYGMPSTLTHRAADAFVTAIVARVEALKKSEPETTDATDELPA